MTDTSIPKTNKIREVVQHKNKKKQKSKTAKKLHLTKKTVFETSSQENI